MNVSERDIRLAAKNVRYGKAGAWDGVSDLLFRLGGQCCALGKCMRCRHRYEAIKGLTEQRYWESEPAR